MKKTLKTSDYLDCMIGLKYNDEPPVTWEAPTEEELAKAKHIIKGLGADQYLKNSHTPTGFKRLMPDCAQFVRDKEVFYSLKNGFACKEVPGELIYFCKKAYLASKCANAVPFMLGSALLRAAFTEGYLKDGWTMCDVIRTFCDFNFRVLTQKGDYCKCAHGYEFMYDMEKPTILLFPTEYVQQHNLSKFHFGKDGILYDDTGAMVGGMGANKQRAVR